MNLRRFRVRLLRPAVRSRFLMLVRHFLRRMSRSGSHPESGEADLTVGPLLGLIAAPGAFASLLLLDKYSTLLEWMRLKPAQDLLVTSMSDKLMFLALSMAVTGIVTVLRQDRLLPDAQDYTNLAHLPVRPRMILLANIIAVATAAIIVAVVANAGSTLLFPLFVASAAANNSIPVVPFLFVHAFCVVLASVFAFLLAVGIAGILTCVIPRRWASEAGGLFRAALLIAFAALLPASMVKGASSLWYFPPAWFLGLYQHLQGREAPFAGYAFSALGWSAVAAGVAYMMGYARSFRFLPEARTPVSARVSRLELRIPMRCATDQAVLHFILRGLIRNPQQRLTVTVSLGLGWLPVLLFGNQWPALCFGTAYLLILGLQLAYHLPVALPSNWIFRTLLEHKSWSARNAIRTSALVVVCSAVILPSSFLLSWTGVCCLAAFSLTHIELALSGEHGIPFTSPFPGFTQSLPVRCLLYGLGLFVSVWIGARSIALTEHNPLWILATIVPLVAIWRHNEREWHEAVSGGDPQARVSFGQQY